MPPFTLLERIPEFLFPFGREAYRTRLLECIDTYGLHDTQKYCTNLIVWHELLHLVGAFVFVGVVHTLRRFSETLAIVLSAFFVLFFSYQELVDQPIRIAETPEKAVTDVLVWVTPIVVYWLHAIQKRRAKP